MYAIVCIGKEIVCIQNINSTLNFYENESFSFSFNRNNESMSKFPMELAYIPNKDMIIITDNLYNIECYRYQKLAMSNLTFKEEESRLEEDKKPITYEWIYSFGENVLHIETVCLDKWYVVLLGERNFCVLRENGSCWFIIKFEVNPSCMCSYANETKDSLVTIVGTHMFDVLIYQNDCLKWATKIPFVPVCIRRGNFADITGALVLLSDDGNLSVGYLGTNPSLKIISMPTVNTNPNSERMTEELKELKKIMNTYNMEGNKNTEQDNKLAVYLDINLVNLELIKEDPTVLIAMLEISTLIPLKEVTVLFYSGDFFEITSDKCVLVEKLEKIFQLKCILKAKSNLVLLRKIKCCMIVKKDNIVRIVNKCVQLPFEQLVQTKGISPKSSKYSTKLVFEKTFEDKASLNVLFEEISPLSAEASFYFKNNIQTEASIRLIIEENIIYHVESNNVCGLHETLKELLKKLRIKSIHFKIVSIVFNLNPIESLCDTIENRLKFRNTLTAYQTELDKFSQHYRVLQKRILIKLKDKNPTSLNNFEKLLKIIYSKVRNEYLDNVF